MRRQLLKSSTSSRPCALSSSCATAVSAVPPHSTLISKWFRLESSPHLPTAPLPHLSLPTPGQILLITGPSGSGKSTFLRRFRRRCTIPLINIPRIALSRKPVIDHFPHTSIESALAHLSRVGLAEAHCYLLAPRHLSEGQRWRLRLALALSQISTDDCRGGMGGCNQMPVSSPAFHCLLCDEFTSLLDPITACVISRVLRRAITPDSSLCAILACSRSDILRALAPDLIIRCDFGSLQFWKKTKGENYVLEGETSQSSQLHPRPPRSGRRHPRRLQLS